MPWPRITIGINPNPGIVALPSWFCIQNYAGQVLTNGGTISETPDRVVLPTALPRLREYVASSGTNSVSVVDRATNKQVA